MGFAAQIDANDSSAQALGDGNYSSNTTVQNLGPDDVWLYTASFGGGTTGTERAQAVVAGGTKVAAGTLYTLSNVNGVDLTAFTVACGTSKTADVRVLAT